MTPKMFIEGIVEAYHAARVPLHPHVKLTRGESRSVASESEDLLAYYLVTRIPSIERILINQPMTTMTHDRIKPDLAICRGTEICALADVKMDLGFKRDRFGTTLLNCDALIATLRGQSVDMMERSETKKKRVKLSISPRAKYLFVVVSPLNITDQLYQEFKKVASTLKNTSMHVLTKGRIHPNQPGLTKEEVAKRIGICNDAFAEMERDILQAIK